MEYYVNYKSVTKAQRAQRELEKRGVQAALVRTPKALQEGGCGYSLRIGQRDFARVRPLPAGHGRVYLQSPAGWEEKT